MRLTIDKSGSVVQYFSPTPAYNVPTATLAATGTIVGGVHTDRLTVTVATEGVGWIRFRATGDVLVYFNDATTATMLYDANKIWDLMLNTAVDTITFINTTSAAVTFYRQGM